MLAGIQANTDEGHTRLQAELAGAASGYARWTAKRVWEIMIKGSIAAGAHMGDDEVTEFIIGRLAELVVALFNEHVGTGPEAVKARSDTRLVLTGLGNWAARNRRADLMPLLHGLAARINDLGDAQEAEPTFYEPIRTIAKVRFRW
jgi:hypothetical protein